MPKLGLGINLANSVGGNSPLTLYKDNFIYEGSGNYTFTKRQFFASKDSSTIASTVGILKQTVGASTGHLICYFDSAKDKYPEYGLRAYAIGEEIYGSIYGHGIFRKTAPGRGDGAGGYPPIMRMDETYGSQAGVVDQNGWTRISAPTRVLSNGESLKISFDYRIDGTTQTLQNALRFGVFKSAPYIPASVVYPYINNDFVTGQPTYINQGSSSNIYNPYSGYSFNFGRNTSYGGIYRRIPSSSNALISTSSFYTQLQGGTATSTMSFATTYNINLVFKRIDTSLSISANLPNCSITTTDSSPSSFSLDTFVFYAAANSCDSHQISNINIQFGKL
jgi:hypothetical protein